MHAFLIGFGLVLVLMIIVHIVFRIIKFTLAVFLLGLALLAVLALFQNYFGIDLLGMILGSQRP